MDKELKRSIINKDAYLYGVDYHTVEIYQKMNNFDFGKLSLRDLYSQDEKNKKLRSDLILIQRRYKIEKLIRRFQK